LKWKVDGTILLQIGTGGNVGMDLLGYGSIQKRFTISCHFPPGKIAHFGSDMIFVCEFF
jgi:hypothetical protein